MKLVFEELSVPLAIPLSIFVLQISLISFDEKEDKVKNYKCSSERGRRGWDNRREMHGNTYTTICKIDSQWEYAV